MKMASARNKTGPPGPFLTSLLRARWTPTRGALIGAGIIRMTTAATLLGRKRQLLRRLQEDLAQDERDEIDRLLAEIDITLNFLEECGFEESSGQPSGSQRPAK
jgi:hypothetical protein